jgi:hypothetical protein
MEDHARLTQFREGAVVTQKERVKRALVNAGSQAFELGLRRRPSHSTVASPSDELRLASVSCATRAIDHQWPPKNGVCTYAGSSR